MDGTDGNQVFFIHSPLNICRKDKMKMRLITLIHRISSVSAATTGLYLGDAMLAPFRGLGWSEGETSARRRRVQHQFRGCFCCVADHFTARTRWLPSRWETSFWCEQKDGRGIFTPRLWTVVLLSPCVIRQVNSRVTPPPANIFGLYWTCITWG